MKQHLNPAYKKQLEALHGQGVFDNGRNALKIISGFLRQFQPNEVFDFGCGHGGLMYAIQESNPGVFVDGYDPGNSEYCKFPSRKFEAVVSTDVFEHIEPEFLDSNLRCLSEVIGQVGFFRIACYPAVKSLPDGRNAHLVVESPDWWIQKITDTMDVEIVSYRITEVDKTDRWDWVKGQNLDVIVVSKSYLRSSFVVRTKFRFFHKNRWP